jgi:hypothetical protein
MPGTTEGDEDIFVVLFSFFEALPRPEAGTRTLPRCDEFMHCAGGQIA